MRRLAYAFLPLILFGGLSCSPSLPAASEIDFAESGGASPNTNENNQENPVAEVCLLDGDWILEGYSNYEAALVSLREEPCLYHSPCNEFRGYIIAGDCDDGRALFLETGIVTF